MKKLDSKNSSLRTSFATLTKEVQNCHACIRMCDSARIFGQSSGPLDSIILFVGEAPGRLGADATSVPFHGDTAGHNFESFLNQVGISRYESFVTNAVLCNPRDANGNNSTPNESEIKNCSAYLKRQIDLIDPQIIVTLGATALNSLQHIESHFFNLRRDVRTTQKWYKRFLIPLYHPGQRALIHRSFANQLSDYQFVAETLRRLSHKFAHDARPVRSEKTKAITKAILRYQKKISYFTLHKLFYLVEYEYYKKHGKRISNAYIIRQKDGPYCTDLHIKKLKSTFPSLRSREDCGNLTLLFQEDLFSRDGDSIDLDPEELATIELVIRKFGHKTSSQIKTATYLTNPMRRILADESRRRLNLFNTPITF